MCRRRILLCVGTENPANVYDKGSRGNSKTVSLACFTYEVKDEHF